MNALIKFLVFFLFIVQLGYGKDFQVNKMTLNSMALELLDMEKSGYRVEIDKEDFQIKSYKFIKQKVDIPNESIGQKVIKITEKFKIIDTKLLEDNIYKVSFEVEGHKDFFLMIVHTSKKKIQLYGAVEFISAPKNIYISKDLVE